MIQVIGSSNRSRYEHLINSYSRLRYEVFVKKLGWNIPCQISGVENDEFDEQDTIYLIVQDEYGKVIGGARLLDTSHRSLLKEIFPYLVEGPPPSDPMIYEVTRFVVDFRYASPSAPRNVCTELLWGLQEFGRSAGLQHLVSVSYVSMEPILRRAGYRSVRLGKAVEMDGTQVVALMHDICPRTLETSRRRAA